MRVLGAMALLEVFRAIAAAEVSGVERKFLRRRALELATSPPASGSSLFEVLGETLAAVGEDTVPLAKAALRRLGASQDAARLGRVSRLGNAAAHPDVRLARDVSAVMQRTREETAGSCPSEAKQFFTTSPARAR